MTRIIENMATAMLIISTMLTDIEIGGVKNVFLGSGGPLDDHPVD